MEKAMSGYQEQTLSPVENPYLEAVKGLEKTAKKKIGDRKR